MGRLTLLPVLAIALVGLGAKDCGTPDPVPPPQPYAAGGSSGDGGSPGFGGSPEPSCSTTCCRSCQVLRDHSCIEGQPTPHGATCEERNCGSSIPDSLALADLSACASLTCIRVPGKGKRGVACEGGK
jgi:hypothetical protein